MNYSYTQYKIIVLFGFSILFSLLGFSQCDITVSVTASNPVCFGSSVTLTTNAIGNYAWSTGSTSSSIVVSPVVNTTYSLTATSPSNCPGSAMITVSVNPLPLISGSVNNPTVCSGSSVILSGAGSVSGYTWSSGVSNNAAFVPTASSNYVVTGTGANGCTNTAVVSVTVILTPTIAPVASPTAICVGSTATLSATGATNYTWTPGSNLNTGTVIVSPPASTTYTVFRNNNGCTSTRTISVIVNPIPLITAFASPNQVCAGNAVTLTSFGPLTSTWFPGGVSGPNTLVSPTVSTNYTIVGSNINCTASVVVSVSVTSTPVIILTGNAFGAICAGSPATLTANSATSYTWSTGASTSSIVVTPTITSSYTLTGLVAPSCITTTVVTVTVQTTPTITAASSNSVVCLGKPVTLTASGAVTYTWSGGIINGISFTPTASAIYTVSGTNACGTASTIVGVATNPTPSILAGPNQTVCAGSSISLIGTGSATSYTWSGGVLNNVSFVPLSSGNYTVTGSSAQGCTATAVTGITVIPTQTIMPVGTPSAICLGSIAVLSASSSISYTWLPVGVFPGSTSASVSVSPTVTTTYSVVGTASLGCVPQAQITVTVAPAAPTLTITSVPGSSICPGATMTITASGATTYTWTNGIGNGLPYTPLTPSIYTVTADNACGFASATTAVSFFTVPIITASISNPTICSGTTITLSGGGGVSYSWSNGAPNNSAFQPANTGNYTVTGLSVNGCSATAVTGVTVITSPTLAPVASPTAVCAGSTATLSAGGATGFTWTPGTNLYTPTITVSPPISTTYTLFRANGPCTATSTLNLVVNLLPFVSASATPSQVCAGTGINLVVTGAITNTWLPGGSTQSNTTVYPNLSTSYTVTGSNGNCTVTAVVPVSVTPSPTIGIISSTTTICAGNSLTLTGLGGLSYNWQPMNTTNTVEIISPVSTTVITLFGTNSFSCTTSATQAIAVNPVPNMSLTSSPAFICATQNATIAIANPANNVVYSWNIGPNGSSIPVNPTITTTYSATGTNTITGCSNTNTIVLPVYIATFVVISPTAICKGETATLTATGSANNYSWTANGGVNAQSVIISPLVTTVYSVTGTTASCSDTKSFSIIVNPLPNVSAQVAKAQICRFEVSTITGSGANSYNWSTGANTPTISFTLSVTTIFTVTGTDLNGCSMTTTVSQFVATCLSLDEQSANHNPELFLYPNPNNGSFTVHSDVKINLNIVNAFGQTVDTILLADENSPDGYREEITVCNLPNGIYFITGQTNGLRVTKKIVVEK